MTRPDRESDVPRWTRDAVIYQTFVDRFSRTGPAPKPWRFAPWGSRPTRHGFMGGNLNGIMDRLDYLQDFGVTVLCLTPIFSSASNHRYNTYDYYALDPRVGTPADFQRLVEQVHARGMRLLLDGVFHHCGRGFYPFYDVLEHGARSVFHRWFHIQGYPVRAFDGRPRYRGWQGRPVMPIYDLANREVRAYLCDVARWWTAQGIDGWRLDAVGETEDLRFWKELHAAVRAQNPDAYLLAEIWDGAHGWLASGAFDGATDYPFREAVLAFAVRRSIGAEEFAGRLERLSASSDAGQRFAMANLLGSHDTARLWTLAGGDVGRIKLAMFIQFVYPGIPAIYYGDEIGLPGGRDPGNRRAMEWNPDRWNTDLRAFLRSLADVRRAVGPLREGDWSTLFVDDKQRTCGVMRRIADEHAIVLINGGDRPCDVMLDLAPYSPAGKPSRYLERLTHTMTRCHGNRLIMTDVPPQSGLILTPDDGRGVS